jgi:hypothetical protein
MYGSALPTYSRSDAGNLSQANALQSLNTWSSRGPWGGYVYNLAIAPSNPDILYAWTEDDLFKSTDGGASWKHAGCTDYPARHVAIDTFNPQILYIKPNVFSSPAFKSTDGGATWKAIGPPDTPVAFLTDAEEQRPSRTRAEET